ncbi:OmpW family protein [Pelagicoccus sp. NFK12]|uniref:OmpW family protein n=1 Tax=Pelagicoccus enzymogenes TaxID=2773457 RepID=A0A927IJP4_9BACT|nr:OmpW family outer membrane protein [Pelagicoccus enzymogenes]MBD5781755.1 OmpW family protein [Pelagicoccus enzymogenes]
MTKPITLMAAAMAAASLVSPIVWAAPAGTIEVKYRMAYLDTANESDAFSALGIDFASDAVTVESKWIPELDIAYHFTENLVGELVLTVPQKHDVYLAGVGKLGSLEHLPPTLSLIYEFQNESGFVPYVSGGLNFTWITNKRLAVAGVELDLEDYSVGLALGTGFKYEVNEKWDLDASVKWIDLESDVMAG